MSIDEAVALKAVRDGLEGSNVPIVHEEIRVVLVMALERDVLKARAETAERDLDMARGLIARLGDPDSLESLWVLLRHERARVAELERERDEARERVLVMSDAWKAAMDNVARLRFALEWCEANWTTPAVDRGAGLPMVRAALASTPRAEPTPRDMRVAEAVAREYERKLDLTGAGGLDIDLAAVVAKAVGT